MNNGKKISKRIRRKKQIWKEGDYFLVPLLDGEYGIGQVLSNFCDSNGAICALFDPKIKTEQEALERINGLTEKNLFSVIQPIPVPLDSGDWLVICNDRAWNVEKHIDVEGVSIGEVSMSAYSYGIIDELFNAYHGLAPWDGGCGCYDEMLVSPKKKPKKLLYIKDCDKWWHERDYFLVPLENGENGIGQVLKKENEWYTIKVILFDVKVKDEKAALSAIKKVTEENIFTATTIDRGYIDEKRWKVIKKSNNLKLHYDEDKYEKLIKDNDFDGYRTPAIIARFCNAYYGLDSWDIPYQPKDYLDKLLISPDKKPKGVVYRFPPKGKKTR